MKAGSNDQRSPSTSTVHVLNNRLGYWNQLTKLYLLNQTIYQLSPVTINSKQTKPFANGTAAFVCAFGQPRNFALTSIKKYVPSPCHEATVISTGHAQTIYPAF